jgi:gamma-glutamyltranspeptidase/glutathione hydrolase
LGNTVSVSENFARQLEDHRQYLQQFSVSRRIFLNDGKLFRVGDTFRQPELAATLKRIAKNGAAEFYRGETARLIVDDMKQMGGLITLEDLAQYQPKIRQALQANYELEGHKWSVITSPPPSSGGIAIIEAMNMLRDVPLKGWDDLESVHMVVETMRRVFADRAAYLADPDFSSVPVDGLTSDCYAKELEAHRSAARSSSKLLRRRPACRGISASNELHRARLSVLTMAQYMHFSVAIPTATPLPAPIPSTTATAHVTSSAGFL